MRFHLEYQFDNENAEGANFDYDGHKLQGSFLCRTPFRDTVLSVTGEYHYRDYDNVHSFFAQRRRDKEFSMSVVLAYPLPRDLTLSLEYLRDRNDSNLALFDFTRNVFSIGLQWRY